MVWLNWKKLRPTGLRIALISLVFLGLVSFPVFAQSGPERLNQVEFFKRSAPTVERSFRIFEPALNSSLDVRLLSRIYHANGSFATGWMSGADYVAYPVLFGVPIAVWALHVGGIGVSQRDAVSMTGSWLIAAGGALVLKKVIKRSRPHVQVPEISPKMQYAGARSLDVSASMPSGHAAISFALATTASLQYPEWYVVAPSMLLASSISVSRIWLGVHYPSDVLAGATLGVSAAILVHLINK